MFIQQSVVVKEFEKEGFECQPLGYDGHYESDIDYQQCLAALRVPSEDNVVLEDNEYSFIPFDKRLNIYGHFKTMTVMYCLLEKLKLGIEVELCSCYYSSMCQSRTYSCIFC